MEKNKNLLIITFEKYEGTNTIDINTGVILGKRGLPIKRISHPRYIETKRNNKVDNFFSCIIRGIAPEKYAKILPFADKLFALELSCYEMEYIVAAFPNLNLHKDLVAYIKKEYNGVLSKEAIIRFNTEKLIKEEYKDLIQEISFNLIYSYTEKYTYNINDILAVYNKVLNVDLLNKVMGMGAINELVRLYVKYLHDMQKPLTIPKNFMKELVLNTILYQSMQDEISAKKFHQWYSKHPLTHKINEVYEIVIPTCASDVINEGKKLHHCVGGYVDRIEDEEIYIVFLRKIAEPNKSLVTIQLHKRDLYVTQQKGLHNRNPDDNERYAIDLYQSYLNTLKK